MPAASAEALPYRRRFPRVRPLLPSQGCRRRPRRPPPATPPQPAVSTDAPQIVLRASADAWVQVRDRQGPVLLNRVMRAGDTWVVPAKGQLLLTTGNAGGTELLVNGVVAPSLGGDGAVRRDLPLDAELIKDGKLSPPALLGAAKPSPKP